MTGPLWLDVSGLPVAQAADAIEAALREGLDPEADPPRSGVPAPGGEILLMPAVGMEYAGVKLVTVAPDNPARGLPRVQGVYVLYAGSTLTPLALADGAELTALRTPAVSAVAIRRLTPDRPLRTVVFGTGPQAWGHVRALREIRPPGPLTVVGRDPGRTAAFLARCEEAGIAALGGRPDAVHDADLVLCCTTAAAPIFDGALPPATACVVAVGSHQPHTREVDAVYVGRAACYVEARAAASREAGELVGADPAGLVNLAELATAEVDLDRPRFFKSVGMAWEDLVVAAAAYQAAAP